MSYQLALAESLAEFLHTRIVAAANAPVNDPDEKFCKDCLNAAGTWLTANLKGELTFSLTCTISHGSMR